MFGQGPFIVPLPFGAEDLPCVFEGALGIVVVGFALVAVPSGVVALDDEVCALLVPLDVLPVEAEAPAMPIAAPVAISAAPATAAASGFVIRMRQDLLCSGVRLHHRGPAR
jgi:hypothetical protein